MSYCFKEERGEGMVGFEYCQLRIYLGEFVPCYGVVCE